MSQKLRYDFQCNGWTVTMLLHIEYQSIVDDTIDVQWELKGFDNGNGKLNLSTGILTPSHEINVRPYEDTGKIKTLKSVKVAKYQVTQIKAYLN